MSDDTAPTVEPTTDVHDDADPITALFVANGIDAAVAATVKDELGVTTTDDLGLLTEADLTGVGIKPVPARKLLAALAPAVPTVDAGVLNPASFDSVLPSVPDDGSWLTALKAGGVLKVDQSTVISVVRAGLAARVGLFDVPDKLVDAMQAYARANDEPVDPVYYRLRKQLTRRNYGEIFSAIDGLDGNYVTQGLKKELFDRVTRHLWPAVFGFYDALRAWQESWVQQGANPAFLLAALGSGGAGGLSMPPGMMQPPDTSALRDNADAVNDAINRVFAGEGVQIAAALAYDAAQIKKTLEDPRLPALVGAANREQMLKSLGVAVSPTYPRLETNVTRFVLSILQAKDQPSGNEELQYFGTLYMLGSQVAWAELGARTDSGLTGIGSGTRRGLPAGTRAARPSRYDDREVMGA